MSPILQRSQYVDHVGQDSAFPRYPQRYNLSCIIPLLSTPSRTQTAVGRGGAFPLGPTLKNSKGIFVGHPASGYFRSDFRIRQESPFVSMNRFVLKETCSAVHKITVESLCPRPAALCSIHVLHAAVSSACARWRCYASAAVSTSAAAPTVSGLAGSMSRPTRKAKTQSHLHQHHPDSISDASAAINCKGSLRSAVVNGEGPDSSVSTLTHASAI